MYSQREGKSGKAECFRVKIMHELPQSMLSILLSFIFLKMIGPKQRIVQ